MKPCIWKCEAMIMTKWQYFMHSSFAGEENLHSPTLNVVMTNCSCIIWHNILNRNSQSLSLLILYTFKTILSILRYFSNVVLTGCIGLHWSHGTMCQHHCLHLIILLDNEAYTACKLHACIHWLLLVLYLHLYCRASLASWKTSYDINSWAVHIPISS